MLSLNLDNYFYLVWITSTAISVVYHISYVWHGPWFEKMSRYDLGTWCLSLHRNFGWALYSFSRAARTKYHRPGGLGAGGLNNGNVFPLWPESRYWQGCFLLKLLSLVCGCLSFSYVFTWSSFVMSNCPFLWRNQSYWNRAIHVTSFYLNCLFKGHISKYGGVQGVETSSYSLEQCGGGGVGTIQTIANIKYILGMNLSLL